MKDSEIKAIKSMSNCFMHQNHLKEEKALYLGTVGAEFNRNKWFNIMIWFIMGQHHKFISIWNPTLVLMSFAMSPLTPTPVVKVANY